MDPAPPATCPRCRDVPLDDQPLVRHCARCRGAWIGEETLHAHVSHARGEPPGRRLTWRKEARAALPCALCREPMETIVVHETPVDRCPRHGIWFDKDELANVLAAVALVAVPISAAAAPSNESVVPDVVEGGLELAGEALYAAEAAGVAAEAGGAVAEAGGGVFEVVVGGVGWVAEAVVGAIAGLFDGL